MDAPDLIDLHHQATDRIVGCYLLETADGPALHERFGTKLVLNEFVAFLFIRIVSAPEVTCVIKLPWPILPASGARHIIASKANNLSLF